MLNNERAVAYCQPFGLLRTLRPDRHIATEHFVRLSPIHDRHSTGTELAQYERLFDTLKRKIS